MKLSGYVKIDRKIFDNPLLQNGDYFRAWCWMISAAAWKPMDVPANAGRHDHLIRLERGQLSHSIRFMANAWGWSTKSVRTFLNRLEIGIMIGIEKGTQTGTQSGTAQTIITICKYDEYQAPQAETGTAKGTQSGTQRGAQTGTAKGTQSGTQRGAQTGTARAQQGHKEEELKEIEEEESKRGAPAPDDDLPSDGVVETLYAFKGATIRLKPDQFEKWRKANPRIDFLKALNLADDYYTENPPKDGKWFFPVSRWLSKESEKASRSRMDEICPPEIYRGLVK